MKLRTKLKATAILFSVMLSLLAYYIRVSNTVLEIGDADAEAMLTTAVYSVLSDMTKVDSVEYEEFFVIVKDKNGDVSGIITNGLAVNMFTSDIANKICVYLDNYSLKGINVPAGVFTGLKLFSGSGTSVNFKLIKIASARCELVSEFASAGINQVKHSLYAYVTPDVTLKAVGRSRQVKVTVSVLVYENVIVGRVPDTYLGATIVH